MNIIAKRDNKLKTLNTSKFYWVTLKYVSKFKINLNYKMFLKIIKFILVFTNKKE